MSAFWQWLTCPSMLPATERVFWALFGFSQGVLLCLLSPHVVAWWDSWRAARRLRVRRRRLELVTIDAEPSEPSGEVLEVEQRPSSEPPPLPTANVWGCKIGRFDEPTPPGAQDAIMRDAVWRAFVTASGKSPHFCFSGWNEPLTEAEEREARYQQRLRDPDPEVLQ